MSYFLFPEIHYNINTINIKGNTEPIANYKLNVSLTLNSYLNTVKRQIDDNCDTWDHIKKYTNPYEFIHTIIPSSKNSVSKLKPLSRSFYKMVEISNTLHLLDDYTDTNINTFHLAEGPGGFIEAMTFMRKNENDKYNGMTLVNDDPNVPGWNKSSFFLETNKTVNIEYGPSGTGDLFDVENLKYCLKKYNNSMNIITADGGFDFSIDFNKQEILATNLLFAQVSFAIAMQKTNGHFILKIFDIFTKTTSDIIYLLSTMYKQVFIVKPNTSRMANSEKYIVCKYFKGTNPTLINKIISQYHKLKEHEYITSILDSNLDLYYLNKLEEYNAIFGQQQIENISSTINLMSYKNKNDKLELFKKNNIYKCIQWCEKYNIPCNKTQVTNNIFMN
jgi:23S rRNA U2552 (ribose-2'-O)-methylase RlmE/FtsJ